MIYGSICSGIEAATVAWHPLGWTPAFFAEIEKFPSAVLAHHYPEVPNFGDFTQIDPKNHRRIDVLVGGTPCQDFSVAGLRAGLDGDRGNLSLEFGRLVQRERPRWLVWENVPGVLSSHDGRDFAAILGLLAGKRLEVPAGGWGNSGIVAGYRNAYGLAWRVLDAQYVRVDGYGRAVPQRRRRVFVVGYSGDWRRAAAVLFERESLSGNPPPRREPGKGVAGTVAASSGSRGADEGERGSLIAAPAAPCLDASYGRLQGCSGQDLLHGHGHLLAHAPDVAWAIQERDAKGADSNTKEGHLIPVAFSCKDHGADAGETAPTLRAMNFKDSHANAGGQVAIAFESATEFLPQSSRVYSDGGVSPALQATGTKLGERSPQIFTQWRVRRLTPEECEALQGFPRGYTNIPWGRKPFSPDGPRYRSLGNTMAANVMRWIGFRIQMVDALA